MASAWRTAAAHGGGAQHHPQPMGPSCSRCPHVPTLTHSPSADRHMWKVPPGCRNRAQRALYLAFCLWKYSTWFRNGPHRLLSVFGESKSHPSSPAPPPARSAPGPRSFLPALSILRKLHSVIKQPCPDPASLLQVSSSHTQMSF